MLRFLSGVTPAMTENLRQPPSIRALHSHRDQDSDLKSHKTPGRKHIKIKITKKVLKIIFILYLSRVFYIVMPVTMVTFYLLFLTNRMGIISKYHLPAQDITCNSSLVTIISCTNSLTF